MKYRRKPTVIEAVQFNGDNEQEVYAAFGSGGFDLLGDSESFMLAFKTAHGETAYARPGDWVTPDVEPMTFYPILNSFMEENYEPFTYTEELTEESSGAEVLAVVKDKLRQVLPESQVQIAATVLEDYGVAEEPNG